MSAEEMGEDIFPENRCHRRAQGRFTHLPDHEGVGSNRKFILLLDRFLQVIHRHALSDVDSERAVGHIENPTEKCDII